jgi:hypothetical protein
MTALFGVRNASDISAYQTQLRTAINGSDLSTFLEFSTRFTKTVQAMALAGQPIASYDQMESFKDATSNQPAIADAISHYVVVNPTLAARTLPALIAYVQLQLANVTTRTAGFVAMARPHKAALTTDTTGSEPVTHQELAQALKSIGDSFHEALKLSKGAGGSSIRRGARGGGPGDKKQSSYCYLHGKGMHKGIDCRVMLADTSAYSRAMLNAKGPNDCVGGHA